MTETVFCYKIVLGFTGSDFLNDFFQFFIIRECKEHRFNIGIVDSYVLHAVFFLIATSKLMLFNLTCHIVFHVCSNHNSVLCSAIHCLSINVVMLFIILNKPTFLLEHIKVFYCFNIYLRVMLICTGNKINFRFDDMI